MKKLYLLISVLISTLTINAGAMKSLKNIRQLSENIEKIDFEAALTGATSTGFIIGGLAACAYGGIDILRSNNTVVTKIAVAPIQAALFGMIGAGCGYVWAGTTTGLTLGTVKGVNWGLRKLLLKNKSL